mmetsp:Transcript_73373/g.174890  ORF Transcript_73373/g.174890 Transcript_73373/m.174890 type:complete len:211 (-) Transcript_73373:1053-1685(-)
MVHLTADLQSFSEALGTDWQNHKLLAGKTVAGMASTIDNVEGWNWHDVAGCRSAGQTRQVLVEGHLHRGGTSTANGHGHGQDGICTKVRLAPSPVVLGAIEDLDHDPINLLLLGNIHANKLRSNLLVDILHCLEHALAQQTLFVTITKLKSLVDAGGGSAWNSCTEEVIVCHEINLHGGIPARVEDLARLDALDHCRWRDDAINLCHVAC